MIVTYNELSKMVNDFAMRHTLASDFFVVLRQGYTEKDMLESPYKLEVLAWRGDGLDLIWETDWWEGEEYIELWGIYTDEDFIRFVGAHRF